MINTKEYKNGVTLMLCEPTAWSRVILEKPIVTQLMEKFPAFCGTCNFITVFTRARHMSEDLRIFFTVRNC